MDTRKSRRRCTQADAVRMVRLRDAGASYREIARAMGFSPTGVYIAVLREQARRAERRAEGGDAR